MARKLTVVSETLGKQLLGLKSRRSALSVGDRTDKRTDEGEGGMLSNNTAMVHKITQTFTEDTNMEDEE